MSNQTLFEPLRGKPSALKHRQLIPSAKQLPQDWLDLLTAKGAAQRYSGTDLEYIGMPVSGICTGQVYLGGDGQLWHWDIFKAHGGGYDAPLDPRGYHYADPLKPKSPMAQGFALHIWQGNREQVRVLDHRGFKDVGFVGRYPMGEVDYADEQSPVSVNLQAYSPFIPLNSDDSGLPITVLEYDIKNSSSAALTVDVMGWLENKVCRYDDEAGKGVHINKLSASKGYSSMTCSAKSTDDSDVTELDGYGNMTLALLGDSAKHRGIAAIRGANSGNAQVAATACNQLVTVKTTTAEQDFGSPIVGCLGQKLALAAGQSAKVVFAISWFFPKYNGGYVFHSTLEDLPNLESIRRYYASRFADSVGVVDYLVNNYQSLSDTTKRWVQTWYDSSLPTWLLDRVFSNVSTLATQTCHRFDDGRFYGWEGVDCCPGTCQHVWQYAQSVARVFPDLERYVREHIDFGVAWRGDGSIEYRAEAGSGEGEGDIEVNMKSMNDAQAFFAADGQMGTILRVYREYMMSADSKFLERIWQRVKKSIEFMATLDANNDGLLEQAQFHTLDTTWHGEIPWISSLYLATLAAGKAMALAMNDMDFVSACDKILQRGKQNFVEQLYNGEYFVHRADSAHLDTSMNLTEGCYIDQVFGQATALQYGLERVIPQRQTLSALQSLWKYNYSSDIGPYRSNFTDVAGGRWFAMPGEGGLIMCTWPKDDCNRSNYDQPIIGLDVTSEGYFKECMGGFEYQVAAHMVGEGMVTQGLALTRTIHERYHPSRRNPYNEIECSDHYSRAMASYGVFVNACGFHYVGPEGLLSIKPQWDERCFRAPMITAEGWATFDQQLQQSQQLVTIDQRYGRLRLNQLNLLDLLERSTELKVYVNEDSVTASLHREAGAISVQFESTLTLDTGDVLTVAIH